MPCASQNHKGVPQFTVHSGDVWASGSKPTWGNVGGVKVSVGGGLAADNYVRGKGIVKAAYPDGTHDLASISEEWRQVDCGLNWPWSD